MHTLRFDSFAYGFNGNEGNTEQPGVDREGFGDIGHGLSFRTLLVQHCSTTLVATVIC